MRYEEIPFPGPEVVRRALAGTAGKKALRTWQLRWHPDRWNRRLIHEADRKRVLDRVNDVMQSVNAAS